MMCTDTELSGSPVARSVRRGGLDLHLTALEYSLFEYLALRLGQVVSRDEIWDHVYGSLADSASNITDVYIGYLRRKLEQGDLHRSGRQKRIELSRPIKRVNIVRAADMAVVDENLRHGLAPASAAHHRLSQRIVGGNIGFLIGDALALQKALGRKAV